MAKAFHSHLHSRWFIYAEATIKSTTPKIGVVLFASNAVLRRLLNLRFHSRSKQDKAHRNGRTMANLAFVEFAREEQRRIAPLIG